MRSARIIVAVLTVLVGAVLALCYRWPIEPPANVSRGNEPPRAWADYTPQVVEVADAVRDPVVSMSPEIDGKGPTSVGRRVTIVGTKNGDPACNEHLTVGAWQFPGRAIAVTLDMNGKSELFWPFDIICVAGRYCEPEMVELSKGDNEIAVQFTSREVHVTCTDETGALVPGAHVMMGLDSCTSECGEEVGALEGGAGNVCLRAGKYFLYAVAKGHEVSAPVLADASEVRLVLKRGGCEVSGFVFQEGRPVQGARVTVGWGAASRSEAKRATPMVTGWTDARGAFAICGISDRSEIPVWVAVGQELYDYGAVRFVSKTGWAVFHGKVARKLKVFASAAPRSGGQRDMGQVVIEPRCEAEGVQCCPEWARQMFPWTGRPVELEVRADEVRVSWFGLAGKACTERCLLRPVDITEIDLDQLLR